MLIQITLDLEKSPALTLESLIRTKAQKLERFFKRITKCHTVVHLIQNHPHRGKLYNVTIEVSVPGTKLVAKRQENKDVYVAIRDAFDAIERQVRNYAHKLDGRIKTHEDVMHGYVKRIIANDGYGFIEGNDGNEYYFSMTNVSHPRFAQLAIGDHVEYLPEQQNDGFQARRVIKARNHSPA